MSAVNSRSWTVPAGNQPRLVLPLALYTCIEVAGIQEEKCCRCEDRQAQPAHHQAAPVTDTANVVERQTISCPATCDLHPGLHDCDRTSRPSIHLIFGRPPPRRVSESLLKTQFPAGETHAICSSVTPLPFWSVVPRLPDPPSAGPRRYAGTPIAPLSMFQPIHCLYSKFAVGSADRGPKRPVFRGTR